MDAKRYAVAAAFSLKEYWYTVNESMCGTLPGTSITLNLSLKGGERRRSRRGSRNARDEKTTSTKSETPA